MGKIAELTPLLPQVIFHLVFQGMSISKSILRCRQKSCMGYSRQLWRRCNRRFVTQWFPQIINLLQKLNFPKKVFGLQSGGRGWDIAATLRTSHPRFHFRLILDNYWSITCNTRSIACNLQGIHLACLLPGNWRSSPCCCSSPPSRTLPEVLIPYLLYFTFHLIDFKLRYDFPISRLPASTQLEVDSWF